MRICFVWETPSVGTRPLGKYYPITDFLVFQEGIWLEMITCIEGQTHIGNYIPVVYSSKWVQITQHILFQRKQILLII